jgi:hypothetical protein
MPAATFTVDNAPGLYAPPVAGQRSARGTLRALHVINGEHYAGAERVQDLLAACLPQAGVEAGFACLKPNRFAAMRQSRATPLVEIPMRARFDIRPAFRLARIIKHKR